MKKIVSLIALLIAGNAFAGFSIYSIDDAFDAVFPAKPELHFDKIINGRIKLKQYSHADKKNNIAYLATSIKHLNNYSDKNTQRKLLRVFIDNKIKVINGRKLTPYKYKKIKGYNSAIYSFEAGEYRCFEVASLKDSKILTWAVCDIDVLMYNEFADSAEKIFSKYISYFSIK